MSTSPRRSRIVRTLALAGAIVAGAARAAATAAPAEPPGAMPVPRAVATAPVLLLAQRADPVEIDWEATRRGLERRVEDDPADAAAWRRLGDAQARLGRPREALAAYRRAESLGLPDEDLRMAIGDALKDLERHGEAYRAFAGLLDSSDPERRLTACQQVQYLAPYRFQRLAPPTFADLYVQAGRQSIASAAYVDAVARWGVNLRPREQLQLYGIARFTRDNRSGLVGGFPLEYFDNAAVLGAGVRYRPLDEVPLYLVAEAGWSRDLEDLGRDRNRSDVRAGVSFYQEWFTERACTPGATYPMRFVMTVSAESMFRSRLRDTVITTADLRPGIRLRETAFSSLDLFAVGTVFTDSRADRFVQYAQFGAALAWVPDGRYPLKIVGEALRTDFTTGDDATNYNLYLVYSVAF